GDIPIWIGGHTPGALRRVVTLADGWHAAFATADALAHGIRSLREGCGRQKRSFDELTVSVRTGLSIRPSPLGSDRRPLQGAPEQIVEDLERYRALGVRTVLLETRSRDLADMTSIYETFAREIRPRL